MSGTGGTSTSTSAPSSGGSVGNLFSGVGSTAATGASLFNIEQGLSSGSPTGQAQASLGAASLANKAGAFGSSSPQVGQALGAAGGALGIYNGIKQGGVMGYGSAAVGAGNVALNTGLISAGSTVGQAIPVLGAALSTYNAVANYKSGATGSDALNGAEAGAAIGSIIPGIGTLIGGVIGGAVGAISSAFGPGAKDPETTQVQNVINATSSAGNSTAVAASVANPYVSLAGLFDDRSSTLPIYQQYGRDGESKFANGMINQINTAYNNGTINSNSTPQQVYNSVVAPWVNGMGTGWSDVGSTYTATTQGLIQNMVSQYMNGSYKSAWQSVGGTAIAANAPAYGSGQMASTDGTYITSGQPSVGNISIGGSNTSRQTGQA